MWFALDFLEALECGMLVRSGDDPSRTSSSTNWGEPATTWTASKQPPRPIRVLSASWDALTASTSATVPGPPPGPRISVITDREIH